VTTEELEGRVGGALGHCRCLARSVALIDTPLRGQRSRVAFFTTPMSAHFVKTVSYPPPTSLEFVWRLHFLFNLFKHLRECPFVQ
jgi:hypothetical protein